MADFNSSATASSPSISFTEENSALPTAVWTDAVVAGVGYRRSASGLSSPHRHIDVPTYRTLTTDGNENAAADQPLGSVLPIHKVPAASFDHASQYGKDQREPGEGGPLKIGSADESAVPLPPQPRRFASPDEEGRVEEQGNSVDAPAVGAPSFEPQPQQLSEDTNYSSSDIICSEAFAATNVHGSDETPHKHDVDDDVRKQKVHPFRNYANEDGEGQNLMQLANRKRPANDNRSDDDEDGEKNEESAEIRNVRQWPAPTSTISNEASRQTDMYSSSASNSGKAYANSDVARALAVFSNSLHGTTATQSRGTIKPALSPHNSYVPWQLPESSGRDDGGQIILPSFDAEPASANEEQTKSPLPPKPRSQAREEQSAASVSREAGNADGGTPMPSPYREGSIGASTNDDATVVNGRYGGNGDSDSDAAMVLAVTNAPPSRFGGGGVLRHNPGTFTFCGSGNGSQGGAFTIDHTTSSRCSVPGRDAASLSPPCLSVDEESGELAVMFRREGTKRERRYHGGSLTSPLTGSSAAAAVASGANVAHSGAQDSGSHPELTNTFDETFGTMVSTMSTAFSTTTNSVGDGDSSSPADTYRMQMALQMRQALLQTLRLNLDSSNSTASTTLHGGQRFELAGSQTSVNERGNACMHSIVTPLASSRNPSSGAVSLASTVSLSTKSANSPTAGVENRSMAATLGALTTPSPRVRNRHTAAAFHAHTTFFDIDSGTDEEAEGRSAGRTDPLRLSMSEEGSRMFSLSVSNPLMYEDTPISELSFSQQQFNAAVQPPPNLQLTYPFRRHSLTGNLADSMLRHPSPVMGTPTCSMTKLNNTGDEMFSNSTSSLHPPVLKSTARGRGNQSALEAAAAEAVREVNSGNCGVDEEGVEDTASKEDSYWADIHPPPLMLSSVTHPRSLGDSDGSNLRASSSWGISPLNIEGGPAAVIGRRHRSYEAVHPFGWPSPSISRRTSSSSVSKASTPPSEGKEITSDSSEKEGEEMEEEKAFALAAAPGGTTPMNCIRASTAVAAAAPAALVSPVAAAGDSEDRCTQPLAGVEWDSRSLSTSARTGHSRGVDGTVSNDDDDASDTATTHAPNSTSYSQSQIQQQSSMNYGETPELLLDAGSINFHSRRDFVKSSVTTRSINGVLAAAAQQNHTDLATTTLVTASRATLRLDPISITTKRDLSTTTREWPDSTATTTASEFLRHYGDDGAQDDSESPEAPQPSQCLGQFASIPSLHLSSASGKIGDDILNRLGNAATQFDICDGEDSSTPNSGLATANPSGTSSLAPLSPPPPPQHQQFSEDEFAEPAVAPVVDSNEKHVWFASPSEVQFIDPPSSPWVDSDFFYTPDYTRMEFKNASQPSSEQRRANEDDKDEDESAPDEEEEEIVRAVTPFRFLHRGADVRGSPTLQWLVKPHVPSWATRSRRADAGKSDAKKTTATSESGSAPSGSCAQQDGTEQVAVSSTPHNESAEGERAPRVFFTKERLAFRAALMEARRAALQGKSAANDDVKPNESAAASGSGPLPPAGSSAVENSAPAVSSINMRISLAPPPPSAAATVSIALPDFAAPVTSASSSAGTGLLSKAPPPAESQPTVTVPASANTVTDSNLDDDGFGVWVQQGPTTQQANGGESAPFKLTKEWCARIAADLKKRGSECSPCDASAAILVNPARVTGVLRTIFGEENHLGPSAPRGNTDTAAACMAAYNHDADEISEAFGTMTSTALPVSGEIPGVGGVLEALSFTSLVPHGGPSAATPVSSNARALNNSIDTYSSLVIGEGGYVVPWRTHTSATAPTVTFATINTTANSTTPMNDAATTEAGATDNGHNSHRTSAGDGDPEDASLCLVRHIFFPGEEKGEEDDAAAATPAIAASCQVSSFMSTRRLPDVGTAAQWTERDVLLAVQQEQRRMVQENKAGMETERLEDVLRLSSKTYTANPL